MGDTVYIVVLIVGIAAIGFIGSFLYKTLKNK